MTTTVKENYDTEFNKKEKFICDNTSKEISKFGSLAEINVEDLRKLNNEQHLRNPKVKEDMQDDFNNSYSSLQSRTHSCHICKRKYETSLGLRRHIVRSHSKEILLYKCDKCNENFRTRIACNQHRCTYEGEELFSKISEENLCNEFKDNPKNSKKYKRRSKKNFFLGIDEIKKTEIENYKEEELYSCIKCSSVFSSKIKIKKHIENEECFSHEFKQKVNTIKQKYKRTLEIFKKAKMNKKKLKDKLLALGQPLGSSDSESDLNEMETLLVNFIDKECQNINKNIIHNQMEKSDQFYAKEMEVDKYLNVEIETNNNTSNILFLESKNVEGEKEILNKDSKIIPIHTVKNQECFVTEIENQINENETQEESIIFMSEDSQMSLDYLNESEFEQNNEENYYFEEHNEKEFKVDQLEEEFLTESCSNESCYLTTEFKNEKSEHLHIDIINDLTEIKPVISKNKNSNSIDYKKEIYTEEWIKTENLENFIEIPNEEDNKNEINYFKTKSKTNGKIVLPKEKYNEKFMSFLYKSLMKEEVQREKIKKKLRKEKKEIKNKNQEITNNLNDLNNKNQSLEFNSAYLQNNEKSEVKTENSIKLEDQAKKKITDRIVKHQCPYCDKIFANKSILDNHTRLHTGERPFNCSYCERKCIDRVTLEIHERRHTNDRRYNCEYCDAKFFTLFEKNRHQKTWHANGSKDNSDIKSKIRHSMSYDEKRKFGPKALLGEDGLYHCKMCDKVCLTAKTMRKHTTLHLNGKPCPLCSKVFAYKSALERHLLVPHEERNFMCTVCGNRYTSAATLKSHSKVHSEGAIKCSLCPKIFGTIYNFDRHMNHKHKLKNWLEIYPDIIVGKLKENNFIQKEF